MDATAYVRDPLAFAGRVELLVHDSAVLRGNAAGDPTKRDLVVYTPPGADVGNDTYPVVFLLCGFTGRAHAFVETHPWKLGPVALYDRKVAAGAAPPAILVMPDCFTHLGGSQYVNSDYLGRYEDYLTEELVPLVDGRYPVKPGRRGVAGKSSGGFGSLHLAMRHPDLFRAAASISGDCEFEYCFGGEILAAMRGLVAYDMDPARFLDAFREEPELSGDTHAVLNVLAMSACYSPNAESRLGFDLPMDLETGKRIPEVWERWLAFDPVVAARQHADALRGLELLHLECGRRDEFHLQWGLRVLRGVLDELGVTYEVDEHEGGHMGINHRYGPVIAKLAQRLA